MAKLETWTFTHTKSIH